MGRREMTKEEALNLTDAAKIWTFDAHVDMIIKSCDLHWSDAPPDPEPAPKKEQIERRREQHIEMLAMYAEAGVPAAQVAYWHSEHWEEQ